MSTERPSVSTVTRTFTPTDRGRRRHGEAVEAAEAFGFRPPVDAPVGWDDMPALARDFAAGRIDSYFPIHAVETAG